MTAESVLIAALSGRALAASARRAGLVPLVVDAFGDADSLKIAGAARTLPEVTRTGFRARPLIAALRALAEAAPAPPVALVLGSGFEDTPKLVATLARHFPLHGNAAAAVARAKDPGAFFPLLDRLAIPHPETRLEPPGDPEGWLSKRIGGSGGAHIVPCALAKSSRRRYAQRRVEGSPASVLALAQRGGGARVVGFSRQWTVGRAPRPFRYGGAVGPVRPGPAAETRMTAAVEALCGALGLVGLVSFDFLLKDGVPLLLEVNPRPGATLDIFDDAHGALFHAHLAACRGEEAALAPPSGFHAAGVLYADLGPVTAGAFAWPDWTADRPRPGTRIPLHRPLATVFSDGESALEAERNCRWRLEKLARMLYGRARDREPNNAKTGRPRPERVGASGQAR